MTRTAFVTGGTGFLGINLVHALIAQGWHVVAAHREGSRVESLLDAGARCVQAGLFDVDALRGAIPEAVDAVFHVAANTSMWSRDRDMQWAVNVEGTRNVATAALAQGARKFVYTSTVSSWAPRTGDRLTEQSPQRGEGHWIGYYASKWAADQVVDEFVAQGLDATFLCPCAILGPHDLSNWGTAFQHLRDGKLPGLPPGAQPWCHVRDVAAAHIAAVERGRTGERYLLGGDHAPYTELGERIADLLDVKPPRKLPALLLRLVARTQSTVSHFTGTAPEMTPELVHLMCTDFDVDCSKAKQELGYREAPLAEMVADQHAWLVEAGHL